MFVGCDGSYVYLTAKYGHEFGFAQEGGTCVVGDQTRPSQDLDKDVVHVSCLTNDYMLQALSSLALETLHTDIGLAHLSSLSLEYLDLYKCPEVTDAGVAHLSSCINNLHIRL